MKWPSETLFSHIIGIGKPTSYSKNMANFEAFTRSFYQAQTKCLTFVESWADNRWTRSCSSSNSRRNRCSSEMSELGSWSFTPPPGKENTNWFIFSAKITQCIVSDIYLSLVLLLFSRKKSLEKMHSICFVLTIYMNIFLRIFLLQYFSIFNRLWHIWCN